VSDKHHCMLMGMHIYGETKKLCYVWLKMVYFSFDMKWTLISFLIWFLLALALTIFFFFKLGDFGVYQRGVKIMLCFSVWLF